MQRWLHFLLLKGPVNLPAHRAMLNIIRPGLCRKARLIIPLAFLKGMSTIDNDYQITIIRWSTGVT